MPPADDEIEDTDETEARHRYVLLVRRRGFPRSQVLIASGLVEAKTTRGLLELEPGVRDVRVARMVNLAS